MLYDIAPRRKLLLMDTCESGELEPSAERVMIDAASSRSLVNRGLRRVSVPTTAAPAPSPSPVPPRPYLVDRDRFVFLDLARRSGAIVYSSSRGGELSYEDPNVGHGLFTQAVLQALISGQADADHDGWVSMPELRAYVDRRVDDATGGLQHPTIDRDNIAITLALPAIAP